MKKKALVCSLFLFSQVMFAQNADQSLFREKEIHADFGFGLLLGVPFSNDVVTRTEQDFYGRDAQLTETVQLDPVFGVFFLFGKKYFEANAGFWLSNYKITTEETIEYNTDEYYDRSLIGGAFLGAYLKYPFEIRSSRVTVFPLIGIEWHWMFSSFEDPYFYIEEKDKRWDTLWYQFGLGIDVRAKDNILGYIECLFGLRDENNYENKLKKFYNASIGPERFAITIKYGAVLTL